MVKTSNFQKPAFAIRFLSLWRMSLAGEHKFSEILELFYYPGQSIPLQLRHQYSSSTSIQRFFEIDSIKDVTIGTSTSYTKLPTDTPSPKKLPYGTVVKVEQENQSLVRIAALRKAILERLRKLYCNFQIRKNRVEVSSLINAILIFQIFTRPDCKSYATISSSSCLQQMIKALVLRGSQYCSLG